MNARITKNLLVAATVAWPLLWGYAQAPATQGDIGTASGVAAAVPVNLSQPTADVVRLAEAGTADDVLLAYVQNAASLFGLTTDQILYLRDIGLSSPVITAMLTHDGARSTPPPASPLYQPVYPPSAPPAPAPVSLSVPQTVVPSLAMSPPPVYVSSPPANVTYFYDGLAPYGSWIQADGIGWCWQPRIVVLNRGWRPYCDGGHWIYTDAGWYWQSDYSWGWAAFHYGRWHSHPRWGWVWLPDRAWGPAWVVWRSGGDFCGWAPLPPRADFDLHLGWRFNGVTVGVNFDFGLRSDAFTFIALKDFNEHDFAHHRLPPAEVTRVYASTTVVNSHVVNKQMIVNEGIKPERVAAATHAEIRKAAIRDLPAGARLARPQPAERNSQVVYRPQLQAPRPSAHMVAQRVDESHPIQHPSAVAPGVPLRPIHSGPPGQARAESSATAGAPAAADSRSPAATRSAPAASRPVSPAYPQPSNPHIYYPKSYQQASEAHVLPSRDTHSSTPPSSPSGKSNTRSSDVDSRGSQP
jgi:hypothetical protein